MYRSTLALLSIVTLMAGGCGTSDNPAIDSADSQDTPPTTVAEVPVAETLVAEPPVTARAVVGRLPP